MIVPTTKEHAAALLRNVDDVTRMELAVVNKPELTVVEEAIANSTKALTKINGDVVWITGYIMTGLMDGKAHGWIMTTNKVNNAREFYDLRHTINTHTRHTNILTNVVRKDNLKAHRTIRALGFTIGEESVEHRGFELLPYWRLQ